MKEIIEKLRTVTKDPEGDFASMIVFRDPNVKKKYYIEFLYKEQDANGNAVGNEKSHKVAISYCPFTGKKI